MIPSLAQAVTVLAPRFPVANYGWANAIRCVKLEKLGKVVALVSPRISTTFNCLSSSLETLQALRRQEWPALLAQLSLPFENEGSFRHFLVAVPDRAGYTLIGFTPLDRLLGLNLPQQLTNLEFASFSRSFSLSFPSSSSLDADLIILSPKSSFPFRFRIGQKNIYSRFRCYSTRANYRLELSASFLAFDRTKKAFTCDTPLTITYRASTDKRSVDLTGDLYYDITIEPKRWEALSGASADMLDNSNPIARVIAEDWRDLSQLVPRLLAI